MVVEDSRNRRSANPTEMHIFQVNPLNFFFFFLFFLLIPAIEWTNWIHRWRSSLVITLSLHSSSRMTTPRAKALKSARLLPAIRFDNSWPDKHREESLTLIFRRMRIEKVSPVAWTHLFQCTDVSATEVAEDLRSYIRGQFQRVRPGRRAGSRQPQPHLYQHHGWYHPNSSWS